MGRRLERRRRWGPLGCLAALLGASVLTSHFLPTQTAGLVMVPITWEPAEPFIGGNLTMTPGGNVSFLYCMWERHSQKKVTSILMYFIYPKQELHLGPLYTGRETVGPDCSLHIRNLKWRDAGRYTVAKMRMSFNYEVADVTIKVRARYPMGKGVIAGIVVGALAGAVLIGVLLYYGFRYYRERVARRVSN